MIYHYKPKQLLYQLRKSEDKMAKQKEILVEKVDLAKLKSLLKDPMLI